MGLNINVDYPTAKLLTEKGFDGQCIKFYTKPNSKMFGIDEHRRTYPIKNISKKLYTAGCEVALNVESIYPAPTIAEVVCWIFNTHKTWIAVNMNINGKFNCLLRQFNPKDKAWEVKHPSSIQENLFLFNNPNDAYSSGINYFLKTKKN